MLSLFGLMLSLFSLMLRIFSLMLRLLGQAPLVRDTFHGRGNRTF